MRGNAQRVIHARVARAQFKQQFEDCQIALAGGEQQRGVAFFVFGVEVRAVAHQFPNDVCLRFLHRREQPPVDFRLRVFAGFYRCCRNFRRRALCNQQAGNFGVAQFVRYRQGGVAAGVAGINVRPRVQQGLHGGQQGGMGGGKAQCRFAFMIDRAGIGAMLQQQGDIFRAKNGRLRRVHERRHAEIIRRIHLRAFFQQQLQRVCAAILGGIHQRRHAVVVGKMNIRTGFQQGGGNAAGVFLPAPGTGGAGVEQRCPACRVAGVDVRAGCQQALHGGEVAPLYGMKEGRLTVLVRRMNIRAVGKQAIKDGDFVRIADGITQGGATLAVGGVHRRAVFDEPLHRWQHVFFRRQHQGGKTFLVGGIRRHALREPFQHRGGIAFFYGGKKQFFVFGHGAAPAKQGFALYRPAR